MRRQHHVRVDLWYDADCPNITTTRERLQQSLATMRQPWVVYEHVDAGRLSPTVVVDGIDVTMATSSSGCRIDLPTVDQIEKALGVATERPPLPAARRLGVVGRVARGTGGASLIAGALIWVDPSWWDVGLAVLALPVVAVAAAVGIDAALSDAVLRPRARRSWSAEQVLVALVILTTVIGVGIALTFVTPANGSAGVLLFLGLSMTVAAIREYDGCEVLAIPNLILRRRDAIWCPVYTPITELERFLSRRHMKPAHTAATSGPKPRGKAVTARLLSPAAGGFHREVLRHIASTGRVPDHATLAAIAATHDADLQELRLELQGQDLMTFDESGNLRSAYPYSAQPTGILVTSADGVDTHAMCAIDALGVSAMIDQPVDIRATEPTAAGGRVSVHVNGQDARWEPTTAVVFMATVDSCIPCDDSMCPATRIFTSKAAARRWAADNPNVKGDIVNQHDAMQYAVGGFASLLTGSGSTL